MRGGIQHRISGGLQGTPYPEEGVSVSSPEYRSYVEKCGSRAFSFEAWSLLQPKATGGGGSATPEEGVVLKPSNPKDMVGCLKVPFSVLPTPVIAECAIGMFEGALKYGRHNYRALGVRASVYYDATQRHLGAWWEGEDIDAESQLSHVTKAITSLMVLRDSMIRKNWEDDRPPATPELFAELNKKAASLVEQYKDRTPKHYTNTNIKGS